MVWYGMVCCIMSYYVMLHHIISQYITSYCTISYSAQVRQHHGDVLGARDADEVARGHEALAGGRGIAMNSCNSNSNTSNHSNNITNSNNNSNTNSNDNSNSNTRAAQMMKCRVRSYSRLIFGRSSGTARATTTQAE